MSRWNGLIEKSAAVDQIAEIGERVEGERHAAAFQQVERLLARVDVRDLWPLTAGVNKE